MKVHFINEAIGINRTSCVCILFDLYFWEGQVKGYLAFTSIRIEPTPVQPPLIAFAAGNSPGCVKQIILWLQ